MGTRELLTKLRVFGAAGMGEARAGVGIAARGAHVRLGATGGPPAGRVFLRPAHFHAAATHFGFGAVAVTAASWDGAEQGRSVRKKRKRANEKAYDRAEQPEGKSAS